VSEGVIVCSVARSHFRVVVGVNIDVRAWGSHVLRQSLLQFTLTRLKLWSRNNLNQVPLKFQYQGKDYALRKWVMHVKEV